MWNVQYRNRIYRIALCVVAGFAPAVTLAATVGPLPLKKAKHVEPRLPIRTVNLPLVISTPGSYFLEETIKFTTLNTDAITITTDSVTIDLNGFPMIGPGKTAGLYGDGINANGTNNIRVMNGSMTHWRGTALKLDGAANSQVMNVCVESNGDDGVSVSDGGIVSGCSASKNGGDGIKVSAGVVSNCAVNSNDDNGIESGGSSTVSSCSSTFNGNNGIYAGSRTIVTGCQASQNVLHGIQATGQCLISGNECSVNGAAGIHGSAPKSRIEGNTVAFNVLGISITDTQILIIRNSASGNTTSQYSILPGNTVGTIVTTEAAMNAATNSNVNIEF